MHIESPTSFSIEVEGLTEEALDEFFGKIDPNGTGVSNVLPSSDDELVKGVLRFDPTSRHPFEVLAEVICLLGKELEENDFICFETLRMLPGETPESRIHAISFNSQLSVAIKAERSHRDSARNSKRINMLSKEVINLKSKLSESSEAVTQAYMKTELLSDAFVHINVQLTELGATPFNPEGLFIPFH